MKQKTKLGRIYFECPTCKKVVAERKGDECPGCFRSVLMIFAGVDPEKSFAVSQQTIGRTDRPNVRR